MYKITFDKKPRSFFKKLRLIDQKRILKKLKNNPKLEKPLVGKLSGLWSLRIGKYRDFIRLLKED